MTRDRPVNHGSERRSGVGIVVASIGLGNDLLRLRRRLWGRMRGWTLLAWLSRELQLGCVRGLGIVSRRQIDQGVGAVTVGKPCGLQVDDAGIMEDDRSQQRQVGRY